MTRALRHLARPVWNAAERRPRAPVRLVLFAALLALADAGAGVGLGRLSPALADRLVAALPVFLTAPLVRRAAGAVALAAVALAAVAVAGVAVDRRRLRDYGLALDRDWALDFGFGLLLGAALLSLVFAVEYAAGWVVVRGTFRAPDPLAFPAAFAAATVLFLAVGVSEELLLRGYVLTNLAEGAGALGNRAAVGLATLASSVLFGALHAGNPNATVVSTAAVSAAGVTLALGYVLTGDLAVPVGLHVTWNLFQGPVYGYPVSGLDLGVSALVVSRSGPPAVTGGAFGPEAGLTGAGAMLVGSLAIAGYVRRRRGDLALAPLSVPALRWWRWARPVDREAETGTDAD